MKRIQCDLLRNIIVKAIYAYYRSDVQGIEEDIQYLKDNYNCNSLILAKLERKKRRIEINNIFIRNLHNFMPLEKQKIIELKYQKGITLLALSLELNISVAQISNMLREIITEIQNMMFYHISINDIFLLPKIVTMTSIIDKQLDFFEEYNIQNKEILYLNQKRQAFLELYATILKNLSVSCNKKSNRDTRERVLLLKINNPHYTVSDIANECNIHTSSVSMYINGFKQQILSMPEFKNIIVD